MRLVSCVGVLYGRYTMSVGVSGVAAQPVVDGLPRPVRLPTLVQTLWSVFGMESFVEFSLRRYPGEAMLSFRLAGIGDVVSVLDPKLVGEVFTGDSDVLRGGEANAQAFGAIVGPNSLLLLDGERHLYTRRLLLPPFHGEAIIHHQKLVEQIATRDLQTWPLGREFALWPRMRAITLEVIVRAVIGVQDTYRQRQLAELLPAFSRWGVFGTLAEGQFPWLANGALARRMPWIKSRARATSLILREIAEHRASPDGRQDILAMLMAARDEHGHGLTDAELFDHVMTLLGAGHDTTAAASAWCFELVLRHPDVLERCRAAIAEGDEDYLTAVVNETLRMRPVADSAARKLSAPLELGGYRIPTGAVVVAAIRGVQSTSTIWPDPHSFQPERFLKRPAPHTFIPFGGGDRRCIGASFAMMEMKTILKAVLPRIELRPARSRSERATRLRSIAIVPAHGTRVIASARDI